MKCINKSNPKVARLVKQYGEVMTAKIMDLHAANTNTQNDIPTLKEAKVIYDGIERPLYRSEVQLTNIYRVKDALVSTSAVSSTSFSDESNKFKIKNALYKYVDKDGNYFYPYGGENYKVSKNASPQEVDKLVNKIYDKMTNFDSEMLDNVAAFLRSGAKVSQSSAIFGMTDNGPRYNFDTIEKLKQVVDYNKEAGDTILRLSEVASQFPNIIVDPDIVGDDPLVVVHTVEDSPYTEISIFDITGKNLKPNEKELLFTRYMSSSKLIAEDITSLTSSEKGIRDLNNIIRAMSMRKANSKIRFRRISSIQLKPNGLDNSIDVRLTPSGILRELNTFVKTKEGKEFLKNIPEKFAKLLSDDKLLNSDYGQSYIWLLKNQFMRNAMDESLPSWDQQNNMDAAELLGNFLAGKTGRLDVLDMLKHESKRLKKIPEKQRNESIKRELIWLAKSIAELSSTKATQHSTIRDINEVSRYAETPQNMSNPDVQQFFSVLNSNNRSIVDAVTKYQTEHNKIFDETVGKIYYNSNNRFKPLFIDQSNKMFERLWRKVEVKDDNGKSVMVKSMMIHYDINDPDTKKAIAAGELTKEEVEYGAFIVKNIRESFIKLLTHEIGEKRNRSFWDTKSPEEMLEIKKFAEEKYNKIWRDGMIPIMQKTVAAKMFSGDFKGGFSKFLKQLENVNATLEQLHTKEDEEGIENKFLFQSGPIVNSIANPMLNIGNIANAKRLGIIYDDIAKTWKLGDMSVNDDISTDLEMISKYFLLSTERKIRYDKNVLPAYNDLRANLNIEGLKKTSKYVEDYAKRTIYSKSPKTGISVPTPFGSLSADTVLNLAMKTATIGTMTANIPVGITSGAINTFNTTAMGLAQQIGGSHLYGIKELKQAVIEMSKNWGKVEALMNKYGITEMTQRDILENRKHQKARRFLFNSKFFNWFNYATDYYGRAHVMVAQMIKDGTWEAHIYDAKTGEIKYDEKLDKRFYKDGKLTEDGRYFRKHLKENLIIDDVMDSNSDVLPYAYDFKEMESLKDLGNQVIMAMEPTDSSNLGNYWLGRLFLQYKKFLEVKAGQAYSKPYDRDLSGRKVLVKNEDTGEMEVKWQPEYFEGKFQTFIFTLKELGSLKQKPTEFWVNLQPRQKANIVKMCFDVMLASSMFLLWYAADWDDDDKLVNGNKKVSMGKYKRIFLNVNRDLIADINPVFWLQLNKQPIAMVNIAESVGNAAWFAMTGDVEKAVKTAPLPGKSSMQLINETFK